MNKLTWFRQKRAWRWLLPIVLLACLVVFWKRRPVPLDAIPIQTVVCVEFNGLARAGQSVTKIGDPVWKNVLQNTLLRACWTDAAGAERLFRHDAGIHEAFAANRMAAGLSLNPADSLHPLFALDLGAQPDLEAALQAHPGKPKFFAATFHQHTLYTVHLSRSERLVVARLGKLLLFSRFSYLLEDAIAQLEKGDNWWSDRAWQQSPGADAPLRIALRPQALEAALGSRLAENWRALPALLTRNVDWLGLAWDGAQLDVSARANGFLARLPNWDASPHEGIFSVLPNHTALLAASGFSRNDYFLEGFAGAQNADFQNFIWPWLGQEAAFAVTEPFSPGLLENQFIVLAVRDSAAARRSLMAYGEQRGQLRRYTYQTFEINQFLSGSALSPLIQANEAAFRNPVCAVVGRYAVFTGSTAGMELWIDKFIVNETLANTPDFLLWRQKTGGQNGATLMWNASGWPTLAKELLTPEAASAQEDEGAIVAQTGYAGGRITPAALAGWLDVHAAGQAAGSAPQPIASGGSSILWKTPLAAQAVVQPSVIAASGEAFVFMQDARHELYCLRSNGSIAWRRQFDARMLSSVQGIDFQNNGKTCFLFNTARHIWLLDGEGRDVPGFPIQFQSPATNGLTVADFDENHRYSFFVACANGNLYGYDQFGRPLPGWNPQTGVGEVIQPMLHFQRDDKDYLVALSRKGKLSVFGRNGSARFPAVQFDGKFEAPPQADAVSQAPRIVCVNTAGRFFVCSLDGGVFSLSPDAGKEPGAVRGAFAPVGGDARYDYALLKGNTLSVSAYTGSTIKNLFRTRFETAPDTLFAADGKLGLLQRQKRQIFLVDASGQAPADFPLAGDTPFILGRLFPGRPEQILIVGNGASVYAYKLR